MKPLNILAAAVVASFAVAAQAAPNGPGGPGCAAGATAGTPGCPAHGSGMQGRGFARLDTDGDGKLSRQEVANEPRLAQSFDAIDTNKDGFLTKEELQAARGRFGGRGEGWKALDTDGDGKLSRQEVANAPRLAQHFDELDTNKDGFLTPEEMRAARHAHGGRGEGWKKLDTDGDGKLSRQEVANAPRLAQHFDELDTNKDGFLTPDELQAGRANFAGRGGPRGF